MGWWPHFLQAHIMDLREDLGLDDLGRFIVRTITVDKGGNATEMITASSGNSVELLEMNNLEVADAIKAAEMWAQAEYYAAIFNTGHMAGLRGTSKSFMLSDFSAIELKVASLTKHQALDPAKQGQPKRKPQPNRGPLGKKDWK